jgi:molecular chaperone DnaJ
LKLGEAMKVKFKELNEAYQVLSDRNKRRPMIVGHRAFENGSGGSGQGPEGFGDFMSDIFEEFFGEGGGGRAAGSGRARARRGLRFNLEITLEEAFQGKAASIRVPTAVTCDACTGTGAKPGTKPRNARPAAVMAGCARARASSRSNAPARPAMAAAR